MAELNNNNIPELNPNDLFNEAQGVGYDQPVSAESYKDMGFVISDLNPSALVNPEPSIYQGDPIAKIQQSESRIPEMTERLKNSIRMGYNDVHSIDTAIQNEAMKYVDVNTSRRVYDVAIGEKYDTLSDGTLIPKYKNFKPGIDNEARLYNEQSTGERWMNGILKFGVQTPLNILGGLVNPVYGAIKAIQDGNIESLYNNDLSSWLDDQNKRLRYNLPNYMDEEERDMNFFNKLATANFWANDVLGAASFTLGALGTEAILAYATGGTSIASAAGRMALRAASKAAVKGAFKKGILTGTRSYLGATKSGMNAFLRQTQAASGLAGGLHTLRFTYTSAGWEASVEASGFRREATRNYLDSFYSAYGRYPTESEFQEFSDNIVPAANTVFAANIGIVGGSNIALFGKYFGVGTGLGARMARRTNRLFGIGMVRKAGENGGKAVWTEASASAARKFAGKAYYTLRKPFSEGIWEEGMQGVVSTAADEYIQSRFDPYATEKNMGVIQSLKKGFSEQFTSKEGWNEIGIGMLIGGFFGGDIRKGQIGEFGAYGRARANNRALIEQYNLSDAKIQELYAAGLGDAAYIRKVAALNSTMNPDITRMGGSADNILASMAEFNAQTAKGDEAEVSSGKGDFTSSLRQWNIALYSRMKMDEMLGVSEDTLANFDYILDSTDSSVLEKQYGLSAEEVKELKEDYKADFRAKRENYKLATQFADTTVGEVDDTIRNAVAINVFLALEAQSNIDELAGSMESLLNITGLKNAINVRQKFSSEDKAVVEEINKIDTEVTKLSSDINALNRTPGTKEDNDTVRSQADNLRIKLEQLQSRRNELTAVLSRSAVMGNLSIDSVRGITKRNTEGQIIDSTFSIEQLLSATKELERVDGMVESMKKYNPEQFRIVSTLTANLHDQLVELHSYGETIKRMSDSRFMKEYQKGLLSLIKGVSTKYESYQKDIDAELGSTQSQLDVELRRTQLLKNEEEIAKQSELGNISEDEHLTFTALNRMLDVYQYNGNLVDTNTGEVIRETISNDTLNSLLNNELLAYQVEPYLNEMARKMASDIPLSNNEKQYYDQREFVRNEVNRRSYDLRITRGDSVLDKLEKLKVKADLLKAPTNLKNYIEILIDNFINENKSAVSSRTMTAEDAVTRTDVNRFKDLLAREDLNNTELEEFSDLLDKIDKASTLLEFQPMQDFIQMLSMMENSVNTNVSNIAPVENISDIEYDPEFNDVGRNTRDNSDNMQNPVVAQTRLANGKWYISNISMDNLVKAIGLPYSTDSSGNVILRLPGTEIIITKEPNNGQISIKEDDAAILTQESKLIIQKVGNVATNWVTLHIKNSDGSVKPIFSNSGYGPNGNQMIDQEAVANLKEGDPLSFEVDVTDAFNVQLMNEYNNAIEDGNQKRIDKAKKNLIDNLVLKGIDKKGNFVSVHKSLSGQFKSNDKSLKGLEAIRLRAFEILTSGVSDNIFTVTDSNGNDFSLNVMTILPGRPNLNMSLDADGNVVVNYINFTGSQNEIDSIADIGFVNEKGELILRNETEGVSKAFVSKIARQGSSYNGKKVPVVVIKHPNGNKYAYPVSLTSNANTDIESAINEINTILERETAMSIEDRKSISMFAIQFGLNASAYTIAFNTDSDNARSQAITILDRLSELSATPNINEWVSGTRDVMDVLIDEATINIDLNGTPFYAMKVKVDMAPAMNADILYPDRSVYVGGSQSGTFNFIPQRIGTQAVPNIEVESEEAQNDRITELNNIASNSNDIVELADAYEEAMMMSESENLLDWQNELLNSSVGKNQVEMAVGKKFLAESDISPSWFRSTMRGGNRIEPTPLDTLAQELGVTEQEIIDFIFDHPRKSIQRETELTRDINNRFRKVGAQYNISGINSASARNFLNGIRAGLDANQASTVNTDNALNNLNIFVSDKNVIVNGNPIDINSMESYDDLLAALNQNQDMFGDNSLFTTEQELGMRYYISMQRRGTDFSSFKQSLMVEENKPESGDELPFQSSAEEFKPMLRSELDKLVNKLKQNNLAYDVVVDINEFNRVVRELNNVEAILSNKNGQLYGFINKDGTVYLRPDRLNANTPMHEFGHLWARFIKANNTRLFNQGVKLIKQSPYWNLVNSDPLYSGMSEDMKIEEAISMAIGDKGAFVIENNSLADKLKKWLDKIWKFVGEKLAGIGLTDTQIEDLTLDQFTEIAVTDLLSGQDFSNIENENKLVSLHNTSMTSISDIIGVGGVVHSDLNIMNDTKFGDITLIGNKEYINPTGLAEGNAIIPLSSFSVALVPAGTSSEVTDALKNIGISVFDYSTNEERLKRSKYLSRSYNLRFQNEQSEMIRIKEQTMADNSFMLAPNGQPTNLTERQWLQVRTTNFKNWFGDWQNNPDSASKVIDANGEPLVTYHGSPNMFTEFDSNRIGSNGTSEGQGYYFTNNPRIARGYLNGNGFLYESFLNIRKPLNSERKTINKSDLTKLIKEFDPTGEDYLSNFGDVEYEGYDKVLRNAVTSELEYSDNDVDMIGSIINSSGDYNGVQAALSSVLGYDGIIEENAEWGEQSLYIPTQANQIKSATANNGEFSAATSDMRFQRSVNQTVSEVEKINPVEMFDQDFISELRKEQNSDINCK